MTNRKYPYCGATLQRMFPYFGAKIRIASLYPTPERYSTVIEPFAGSLGYSLHYANKNVIAVEKYHKVAAIWKYLITCDPREILATRPDICHVSELDPNTPEPLRWLIGFYMNLASSSPCLSLTQGMKRNRAQGRDVGWSLRTRNKIAKQVPFIKHWKAIEGDYSESPDLEDAVYFCDPPYRKAGTHYKCGSNQLDYDKLAKWCRSRKGLVIVCENAGADWLPFKPLAKVRCVNTKLGIPGNRSGVYSDEVIWVSDDEYFPMRRYFKGWTFQPANNNQPEEVP